MRVSGGSVLDLIPFEDNHTFRYCIVVTVTRNKVSAIEHEHDVVCK